MFGYYVHLHFESAKNDALIFLLIHKMGHEQLFLVSELQVTWGFLAGWGKFSDPMHNFILEIIGNCLESIYIEHKIHGTPKLLLAVQCKPNVLDQQKYI